MAPRLLPVDPNLIQNYVRLRRICYIRQRSFLVMDGFLWPDLPAKNFDPPFSLVAYVST